MERMVKLSQSEINQILIEHLVAKKIAPPKIPHTLLWNTVRVLPDIKEVELTVTIRDV